MIAQFFASRGRAVAVAFSAFAAVVGSTAGMAACSDDSISVDQQIQNFCTSYMNSSGFACCSADKTSATFASRYKYNSVDACVSALSAQYASSDGAQAFDSSAAASCLSYVGQRTCGLQPLLSDRQAEEQAGCDRVLKGSRVAGQPCATENDCQAGLFCPPTAQTGSAVCATPPAVANQTCNQSQVESVDHPACDLTKNLICLFASSTTDCPTGNCPTYVCVGRIPVPADAANNPEHCTGTECVAGATCTDLSADPATAHNFVCQNGGPAAAGKGCLISEHCQAGLYCDTTTAKGICTAQKPNGAACNPANNATIFECQGTCGNDGKCATFCGKG